MPSVTNVGGSLTSALALTALAAAVRLLRGAAAGRGRGGFFGFFGRGSGIDDDDDDENGTTVRGRSRRAVGRYFAPISPTSLRMLVRREKRKEKRKREKKRETKKANSSLQKRIRRQRCFFFVNLQLLSVLSPQTPLSPSLHTKPTLFPDRHVALPLRALRRQAPGRGRGGGAARRRPRRGPESATSVLFSCFSFFFLSLFLSSSARAFSSLTPRFSLFFFLNKKKLSLQPPKSQRSWAPRRRGRRPRAAAWAPSRHRTL